MAYGEALREWLLPDAVAVSLVYPGHIAPTTRSGMSARCRSSWRRTRQPRASSAGSTADKA